MAVDVNATRRQRAWDSIKDGASRTWSRQFRGSTYALTLTNPQIRTLHGNLVFTVDVLVTKDGEPIYEDRLNTPNPPMGTVGADGTVTDNPRQAFREHVVDVVRAVTADFTKPHLMRGPDGRFLGDTLAVRSSTADGRITSGNATWTTCLNGSSLSAATGGTADNARATWDGSVYEIRQIFLDFDTSSLGSGATLSNGVFTLYGNTTAETNTDGYDLQIRPSNWGGTLTTADWVDCNPQSNWTALTLMSHFAVSGWSQGAGNANNFTVDSYADVSKTGTTYVVVGMSALGSGTPTGANNVEFRLANQSGTSSDPLLTVTYTPAMTGTIAATLQKALFSGSGAQAQTGTIAATLRKATASLSGAQAQTAAAAATMQKATFAGAGSQAGGTEGTIAATMQRATASASGAMEPSGAIAATQQKATFSGAGAQAQTGAIAATQQKATFVGTGAQTLTSAIAAALQRTVFASSGKTGPAGTIAATITKATAAFAGVMQPSGQIGATMQRARFAASGSHIISGTLAATARKLTFAGTGAHILSGAMAATMQRTRFAGVGHFDNAGAALVSIAKNFLVRVGILKRHEVEIDVARKYNVALSFESSDGVAVAVARTYEVEIIMSNETCYVGNSITATGRFTLVSSGALTDPTTITATVQIPGGTKTTYTYGVDSEMGKTSTGIYTCTFTPSSAGKWIVKFTGAGAVVAVNQEDFTVLTAI